MFKTLEGRIRYVADEWCAWWQAFDDLLLLKRGGHSTYVGPLGTHSVNLINYFEVREGLLQWSTCCLVPVVLNTYNKALVRCHR